MNKQKFMEFVSKAYDKGFYITIADYSPQTTKAEAMEVAAELSEVLELPVHKEDYKSTHSYEVGSVNEKIRGHFFYGPVNFLDEDVDLSGGEDVAV
ncbi:MAG: hypothetical protein ABF649_00525 [Bacillus sp. (in: firmicutes)]